MTPTVWVNIIGGVASASCNMALALLWTRNDDRASRMDTVKILFTLAAACLVIGALGAIWA